MDKQRKVRILEKVAGGTVLSPSDMAVPPELAQQGVQAYTARRGAGWMEAARAMGRPADWKALQKQYGALRAGDQFHTGGDGDFMRVRDARNVVLAPPQRQGGSQVAVRLPQHFGTPSHGALGAPAPVVQAPAPAADASGDVRATMARASQTRLRAGGPPQVPAAGGGVDQAQLNMQNARLMQGGAPAPAARPPMQVVRPPVNMAPAE